MATEKQIAANRANAAKSTGPRTPEGKLISAKNGALAALHSGAVVLKGESLTRFNEIAAAMILEFQPRTETECALVQTMTAARWRILRLWATQTAGFELEMARVRRAQPGAAGAALAALTYRDLADNSRVVALYQRLEIGFDRQYNRALASLLKLRQAPEPPAPSVYPDLHFETGTWESETPTEPNSPPTPDSQPS